MNEYVDVFKALACKIRLRIIRLLQHAGKGLCVCEIMDALEESQYNISRHLKVLKYAGLVKDEKKGRWIEYSLEQPKNAFYENLFKTISLMPEEEFKNDFLRLEERLALRRGGLCVVGMINK